MTNTEISGKGLFKAASRCLSPQPGANAKPAPFSAIVIMLFVMAAIAGCGAPEVKEERQATYGPLIWPPPPEPARISYLRSISRPQDIGAGKGIFTRIVEAIVGGKVEEVVKPYGLATDSAGRLIVADTALKKVHVFDIKKKKYTSIDSAGPRPFASPIAVAVDSSDNIYVTDSVLGKVLVFGKDGRLSKEIDAGKRPTGLAINPVLGRLYVADTGSHNVRVHDLGGKLIKTVGAWGKKPGEFNYPVDVFVDEGGDLYVVDTMNYRVQIFDREGKYLASFGRHGDGTGDFGRPKGVAVDRDGHVYVADALFDTIQIFDRKGTFLLNFGRLGREPGSFWLPGGLAVDRGGKIYVADSYNKRIQVFEYLGEGHELPRGM